MFEILPKTAFASPMLATKTFILMKKNQACQINENVYKSFSKERNLDKLKILPYCQESIHKQPLLHLAIHLKHTHLHLLSIVEVLNYTAHRVSFSFPHNKRYCIIQYKIILKTTWPHDHCRFFTNHQAKTKPKTMDLSHR